MRLLMSGLVLVLGASWSLAQQNPATRQADDPAAAKQRGAPPQTLPGQPAQPAQPGLPGQRGERGEQEFPFEADRFIKDHDLNNDGVLSKDELPGEGAAGEQNVFDMVDANKDGKVDAQELRQYAQRVAQRRPHAVETLCFAIDVPENPERCAQELQQAYEFLRRLDKDGDGQINQEDIQAMRKQRSEERVQRTIERLDRNKDGKISKDEARGLWADEFAQLDKNKDGSLDRNEIEEAFLAASTDIQERRDGERGDPNRRPGQPQPGQPQPGQPQPGQPQPGTEKP